MKNFFILAVILLAACGRFDRPVQTQVVHAQSLSDNFIEMKSYKIPNGIFRGVLWPEPKEPYFIIWLINDRQEKYHNISAPIGFVDYPKDVTADWNIEMVKPVGKDTEYSAEKKDRTKTLNITLPTKNRKYVFNVLKNIEGDEMLVYMDISETVVDEGLFGYIVIKDKSNKK